MTDSQLLQDFAAHGSDNAFRALVERHLPLVLVPSTVSFVQHARAIVWAKPTVTLSTLRVSLVAKKSRNGGRSFERPPVRFQHSGQARTRVG